MAAIAYYGKNQAAWDGGSRPAVVDYNAPLPDIPPAPPGKPSMQPTSPADGRVYDEVVSPADYHSYSSRYGHATPPPQPPEPAAVASQASSRYHNHPAPPAPPSPSPHHGAANSEYYGAGGVDGGGDIAQAGTNPYFADDIPLRTHAADLPVSSEQTHQHSYNPEPESGAVDPSRSGVGGGGRKRRKRISGLRSGGRTPWFVYAMTLIQVTVFIAQIVRNGE